MFVNTVNNLFKKNSALNSFFTNIKKLQNEAYLIDETLHL